MLLAGRLTALQAAGRDVNGPVRAAVLDHSLSDKTPAAALTWRLSSAEEAARSSPLGPPLNPPCSARFQVDRRNEQRSRQRDRWRLPTPADGSQDPTCRNPGSPRRTRANTARGPSLLRLPRPPPRPRRLPSAAATWPPPSNPDSSPGRNGPARKRASSGRTAPATTLPGTSRVWPLAARYPTYNSPAHLAAAS